MNKELLKRIEVNPKILCGKPIIKGTRISVELILGDLAFGRNFNDIIHDYDITENDIRAALVYAHEVVTNEELIEV